jgi:hypothetical protein
MANNRTGRLSPTTAGYSGTPLSKKLGIKEGSSLLLLNAPKDYAQLLEPLPDGVIFQSRPSRGIDIAQIFVTRREALSSHLAKLRKALNVEAAVWVSWPKKAAKVSDRRDGRHHSRGRITLGICRYKGLRGQRDLVRSQAGSQEGTSLSDPAAVPMKRRGRGNVDRLKVIDDNTRVYAGENR